MHGAQPDKNNECQNGRWSDCDRFGKNIVDRLSSNVDSINYGSAGWSAMHYKAAFRCVANVSRSDNQTSFRFGFGINT